MGEEAVSDYRPTCVRGWRAFADGFMQSLRDGSLVLALLSGIVAAVCIGSALKIVMLEIKADFLMERVERQAAQIMECQRKRDVPVVEE